VDAFSCSADFRPTTAMHLGRSSFWRVSHCFSVPAPSHVLKSRQAVPMQHGEQTKDRGRVTQCRSPETFEQSDVIPDYEAPEDQADFSRRTERERADQSGDRAHRTADHRRNRTEHQSEGKEIRSKPTLQSVAYPDLQGELGIGTFWWSSRSSS